MLTDAALKQLKPKEKAYKVTDRDGMYVRVGTTRTISFRLDYRLNGRRETVTIGKYGASGLSLARAREKCLVPFSRGSRACIGQDLARSELYIMLGTLFRRFDDLVPYDVGPEDMVYVDYF